MILNCINWKNPVVLSQDDLILEKYRIMRMRILDRNRANYKRIYSDGNICVFCRKKDEYECVGLRGKHWRVLVTKFPYMDGNVMIVPVRHIEKVENVKKSEWEEFGAILVKTQKVLGKIFKNDSFNIGLNVGPESGASISHLHWQVIPRKFKNITVANVFADLYIVAITPEETKRMIDEETTSKERS
jgi:ATP adenylyltransferase